MMIMMMMARIQWMMLCLSVAILLLTPCSAARGLRLSSTGRSLLTSTSTSKVHSDWTRGTFDEGVPTSSMDMGSEFTEWARFQAQEVSADYIPAGANPDPGTPLPNGY